MKQYRSSGFTLIELMIVVAIIGTLAAIALPQYQLYVSRSQVARGMEEAATLKSTIELCVAESHLNIGAGVGQCDPGATGSDILVGGTQGAIVLPANTGVPQVAITVATGAATITAQFGNSAVQTLTAAGANTLTWSRSVSGDWTCSSTLPARYVPRGC